MTTTEPGATRLPAARHTPGASGWLLDLWWVTVRRRWREHGGALLIGVGVLILLGIATRAAPEGGERLYLSVVLIFATAGIVGAPMVISAESIFASVRLSLLPIPTSARALARLILGNTLRTVLTLVVLAWGSWIAIGVADSTAAAGMDVLRLAGWLLLAIALSQLLETIIRLRRAFILHQLVLIVGLALWPLLFEYLRDSSNFVPAPRWTSGPAGILLFPGSGAIGLTAVVATLLMLVAGATMAFEGWFVARFGSRPAPQSTSAIWTAAVARSLVGGASGSALMYKETLVPLRFLFLRMTLVFIVLSTTASLAWGVPFLLIGLPFWWQPLSTNALGPDVGDGELRYALIGMPISRVLRARVAAAVLLSTALVVPVGVLAAATGLMITPRVGPQSLSMYVAAFVYGLSLIPLAAILGDRYSLRFPDSLEMHTLLPERTRSARAAAVVLLFGLWIATLVTALMILAVAAITIIVVAPGPPDAVRLLATATLASALNVAAFVVHTRSYRPG